MNWSTLLYILGAGLLVWLAIRIIRTNPSSFSRENMGKSVYTIGILTLLIIAIIAVCVFILKS